MLAAVNDAIEVTDGVTVRLYLVDGEVVVEATLKDGRTVTGEIPACDFVGEDGHWPAETILAFTDYFCGIIRFQPIVDRLMQVQS